MASNLRVDNIQPTTGTGIGIGTANGSVTFNADVTGGMNIATGGMNITTGSFGVGTNNPTESKVVISHTQTSTVKHLAIKDSTNNWVRKLGVDSSNNFGIFDGDTEQLRITPAGNIKFVTSGKGIDFSATSDASGMSSELLDDYEEGVFTPVWGDGSSAYSSPAPTYSTQYGHYTKIGNVVYYDINLVTTAWNSAGSVMWIYGLPYTTRSSLYQQGGGSTFCIQGVDSQDAISNLTTQIAPNKTDVQLYYQTPSTGANYNTFGTNNVSEANQVNIRVSGFYFTNS